MKLQNLSVRAFLRKIVAGTLLTAALLLLIFFLLTKDVRVVICGIILTAAFFIWGMVFLHYFQKKLSLFTDGLCQTLSNTPLLILADEPTGNLDSKSSAAVIESFLLAKEKMNATILMVTHDAIAASYADRVVALSDGKIVKELLRTVEPRQFMNEILDFLKVVEVSR